MDSSSDEVWVDIGAVFPGSSRRGSDSTMMLTAETSQTREGGSRISLCRVQKEGRRGYELKVNSLVCHGCLVLEAKGVLADGVGGEDVVALLLVLPFQQHLVVRIATTQAQVTNHLVSSSPRLGQESVKMDILDDEVDSEVASRLDGEVEPYKRRRVSFCVWTACLKWKRRSPIFSPA
jgi:UPF0716 family protein affecting phage T7 exclusion